MPNYVASVILIILFVIFILWVWKGTLSKERLRESLFRNVGVPYRNLIGLLLGATASLLALTSGTWTIGVVTWVFVITLAITIVLLVAVRPNLEKELDRFAWGLLVIIVFGFGLGALIYQTRSWWIYLWHQYLRINNPGAILLEALFLLGVILGFFVVRNWAKDQKEFVSSLSAVLSAAFLSTILGKLVEGTAPAMSPMRAFAYYALGFTLSGTINLIAAARLTSNYTNKRSISSRALLDFLYGSERTKLIDGYFLKNFNEDPDYAKAWLTATVLEYRKLVAREFAERTEQRRKDREKARRLFTRDPKNQGKKIKQLIEQRRKMEPACPKLLAAMERLDELKYEQDSLNDLPEKRTAAQEKRLEDLTTEIAETEAEISALNSECDHAKLERWRDLSQRLNRLKPSYYYQLISIECEEKGDADNQSPQPPEKDPEYNFIYKYLGSNRSSAEDHDGGRGQLERASQFSIKPEMFRVGVAVRRQDLLEYISAPGEYRVSFPYFGSVSGLALMFRQTIVMDCDRYKRFRNKDHVDGICPADIEQKRGLDEIDFLSYLAIPIVSRLGSSTENGLGVVTLDTRLFVAPFKLEGHPVRASEGIFRIRLKPRQLTEFASNLYEPDDRDVRYIQELTKIIVPVVELYSKCLIGST